MLFLTSPGEEIKWCLKQHSNAILRLFLQIGFLIMRKSKLMFGSTCYIPFLEHVVVSKDMAMLMAESNLQSI